MNDHYASRMTTLKALLGAMSGPTTADNPELIVGHTSPTVSRMLLVEDLRQVEKSDQGTFVVLAQSASSQVSSYRLDVAIRVCAAHGVVAIGFFGDEDRQIAPSALVLAEKRDVALVRLPASSDVSRVLTMMSRLVTDELQSTVERCRSACDIIDQLQRLEETADAMISETSTILGVPITLGPRSDEQHDTISIPAMNTEPGGGWLTVARSSPETDVLVTLVLWRLAGAITTVVHANTRALERTQHGLGEMLNQLMESDSDTRLALAPRARRLGINVDGWHTAIHLELVNLDQISDQDRQLIFDRRELAVELALKTALHEPGDWHVARDPSRIVLVWSHPSQPGPGTNSRIERLASTIIERVVAGVPRLLLHCGVGTPQPGLSGLAGTAVEARTAAASARATMRTNEAIGFDSVGIQRTVVAWFGSPSVRESIEALLAPLWALPTQRRDALLDTLSTYLDHQGSTARAADALNMHRNGVRYRLTQIADILDIDLDDPDQRLFVHLACRSRRLLPPG